MAENEYKAASFCKHFVVRKKRHCRMSVKPGAEYCGEHQRPASEQIDSVAKDGSSAHTNSKLRILCPLDRKHTCYAHNLKKHLTICNARPKDEEPYIQRGVNLGDSYPNCVESSYKLLSSFPVQDISNVVIKVNRIFKDRPNISGGITEKILTHQLLEQEMTKPEYGDKTKKHLKQASSILGLLSNYGLMKSNTCYIEFGAGRGHLSYWLSKATESNERSTFLLIERSSPKHKRDNKLDKSEDKVQRIRADIGDLVLAKVEAISRTDGIVGVTKHLCGDATDLAMRCLANVPEKEKVKGCLMTFCCHHRCRWGSYTGKKFLEDLDLSENDFDMMCAMTSWATCGTGYSRERREGDEKSMKSERDTEIGLDRVQKGEVGKKCKHVINWGRLRYMEEMGFKCSLHYYVKPDVSLENVCIIAQK